MRTILHCDLNNFYASVATLDRPELAGIPMVVGGSESLRRGIVLAKNERAKPFGIQTGEPLFQARQKCPGLTVVPPQGEKYVEMSGYVREIYARYTDQVEPFGIDECWLDVTGSARLFGDGVAIADELRRTVKSELGLTISVGVSFNKCFAKLGSDLKKPDGTTLIDYDHFTGIVWPLPAGELFGVGRKTAQKLAGRGIFTIGDIAESGCPFMERLLGKNGFSLWLSAMGLENAPVHRENEVDPIKSIGQSATCARDLVDVGEVEEVLRELSERVAARLRKKGFRAGTVTVSVKDNAFAYQEYSETLALSTESARLLGDAAISLFAERHKWDNPLRALGVRATYLVPADLPEQLCLYGEGNRIRRLEELERKVDDLCGKYGKGFVRPAARLIPTSATARFDGSTALPAFTKIDSAL